MSITFKCGCGAELSAAERHAGMAALCGFCGGRARVPGRFSGQVGRGEGEAAVWQGEPGVAAPAQEKSEPASRAEPENAFTNATPAVAADAEKAICAACGDQVSPVEAVCCRICRGWQHLRCWTEKGGCAVPACAAGPASRRRVVLAAGREEQLRPCPVCAELIPERAHRCRYCGEFTDADLRKASKKRFYIPRKTSYLAGYSVICAILSFIICAVLGRSALGALAGLAPLGSLALGVWAIRDIRASAGEKSGYGMAAAGLILGTLALFHWLSVIF